MAEICCGPRNHSSLIFSVMFVCLGVKMEKERIESISLVISIVSKGTD